MTEKKLKGPRIEIVEDKTGKVIDVIKLSSTNRKHAQRVDSGLNINLDHDRFTSRIVLEEE